MPKTKPTERLLKNHVQVLFNDQEYNSLKVLAELTHEGNLSKLIRSLVLQAIQPVGNVTIVSTAPVAE